MKSNCKKLKMTFAAFTNDDVRLSKNLNSRIHHNAEETRIKIYEILRNTEYK